MKLRNMRASYSHIAWDTMYCDLQFHTIGTADVNLYWLISTHPKNDLFLIKIIFAFNMSFIGQVMQFFPLHIIDVPVCVCDVLPITSMVNQNSFKV